jgi:ribosome-associated heat shock protein Hsp15
VPDGVRVDKWLWAARFFRTRSIAREAIRGGKVRLQGHRVKPGRQLVIDDVLTITRGEEEFIVTVLDLGDRRLSAPLAREKYAENPESIKRREEIAEQRRLARQARSERQRRPDKRQRRQIVQFTRKKGRE